MAGHVFIARGDVTRLSADALVYPASGRLHQDIAGLLLAPFSQHVPGFREQYARLEHPQPLGATSWIDLRPQPDDGRKPYGVVVVVSTGGALTPDQEGQLFDTLPGLADEVRDAAGDDRHRLLRTAYAV